MRIGIDGSNITSGGGVTHLYELLSYIGAIGNEIEVDVWASNSTIEKLPSGNNVHLYTDTLLNKTRIHRFLWRYLRLKKLLQENGCDVCLFPGGLITGGFNPAVVMCRNMLPFEPAELLRYGFSLMTLRLYILRFLQSRSFSKSDGIIFLTEYARNRVLAQVPMHGGKLQVIPHGINPEFRHEPKPQHPIQSYSLQRPFKLIYVSIIDEYKHQSEVVEAVSELRRVGYPVQLELIGPAYGPALARLRKHIHNYDHYEEWIKYQGFVDYKSLPSHYANADLAIYASSCENLPNILIESMAAGLPIASSNLGPMPEILGCGGIYFAPDNPSEIFAAVKKLLDSPLLRAELANVNYKASFEYDWSKCARQTLKFIAEVCDSKLGY